MNRNCILRQPCVTKKTFIDIGAAERIYIIHIIHVSRDCLTFEPLSG